MSKWKFFAQYALCAIAIFMVTHSIGIMCIGRYYQPEEPKELSKFKNN